MAGFLLDTNVISELVRPSPSEAVLAWFERRDPDELFLSALTIGELIRGVERLAAGARRTRLETWVGVDLAHEFFGRILPFDRDTAVIWGRLMGENDRRGTPRPAADAHLAATAIQHGLRLVARNTKDFVGLLEEVVDPWKI